jgi:hypothetical protein
LLDVNVSEAIRHQKILCGTFVLSKKQFLDAIALVNVCESEWVTMVAMEDVESLMQGFLSVILVLLKQLYSTV